jgi:hypothetical protein
MNSGRCSEGHHYQNPFDSAVLDDDSEVIITVVLAHFFGGQLAVII